MRSQVAVRNPRLDLLTSAFAQFRMVAGVLTHTWRGVYVARLTMG